jgi:serine/threonine protein kinase
MDDVPFSTMAKATPNSLDKWPPVGNDSPTQSRGAGDATLPLGAGMTPGFSQAHSDKPATHLGPYELIEKLGQGGMGTVWKSRHTKLDKLVALKLLPPHLMSDADAVSRFEREMKAVGKLEHAHIVRAMDAGEADGVHYLVMEYIEGIDLAKLVKQRGPRKLAEACQMIRHAALGLAHAHEHGLVHRDIKPSNLLLSKKGLVKILDLGLARLQTEKAVGEASLTVHGEVMGTPDYMAPEQWQSAHHVGPAADLYALGCTLYFLLTGKAPFAADDQTSCTQKMTAHLLKPPPALPEVPAEVEALYQKLMAKESVARPTSAKAVADELRELIGNWTKSPAPTETIPWTPVSGTTPGKMWEHLFSIRRWWLAAAFAGALLALGGLFSWNRWDRPKKPSFSGEPPPPLAIAPFDEDQAREFQAIWSRHLKLPVEYANSLGMKFRLIPPGEYGRGTTKERSEMALQNYRNWLHTNETNPKLVEASEAGIRSESPAHRVRIVQPFYLSVCEVTQGQFEKVMKQNRAYFSRNGAGHEQVDDKERPNLPMENITFEEALEFCRRLSEQDGLSTSNEATDGYRLPTDAEWEYACRAGNSTPLDIEGVRQTEPSRPKSSQLVRGRDNTPLPVGKLLSNHFGLHDMRGNVWELCQDYFAEDEYSKFGSNIVESPVGPASGRAHIARGGAYNSPLMLCRAASRLPVTRLSSTIGFRPALTINAVQAAKKPAQ